MKKRRVPKEICLEMFFASACSAGNGRRGSVCSMIPFALTSSLTRRGLKYSSIYSPGHEEASRKIKAQRQSRRPRDADARSRDDGAALLPKISHQPVSGDEQLGFPITQINAIKPTVNIERLTEFARAVGQILWFTDETPAPHRILPEKGLNGANEHGLGDSRWPANCVDAEMITVNQIHIPVAGCAEHDAIARSESGCAVASRIVAQIRLGLNNSAAAWTIGRAANEPMAEQLRRNEFG